MSAIFSIFANRRMLVILLLGFASGIPLGLTGAALQTWFKSVGLRIETIGLLTLVGLPYALKFLWAPMMDRFVPPFLGRRRGWILIAQAMLVVGIVLMAATDPSAHTLNMAVLALMVAFFSASQDIVIDAYRTDILAPNEVGAGSSVGTMGYRLGMLASGALALVLADYLPWRTVYYLMAGSMGIGVLATFLAPEPQTGLMPPRTLADSVVKPLAEFLRRRGAVEILLFILLFKLDVAMTLALQMPFMKDLTFTNTDIGLFTNTFGVIATIVGAAVAGPLMVKLGVRRGLWVFGLVQGLAGLSYALLAWVGRDLPPAAAVVTASGAFDAMSPAGQSVGLPIDWAVQTVDLVRPYPLMIVAVVIENLCAGMGTVAYIAFLMSICDKRFTAFQYALFTSLMALTRVLTGPPAGWLEANAGWTVYFLVATFIAAPGLILLLRYRRWTAPESATAAAAL